MPASHSFLRALAAFLLTAASGVPFAHAQCTQPAANGQIYNSAGANLDGASSQNLSGTFSAADNITASASGTITSLCFWGRYNSANIPAANLEQFRVTF